MSAGVRRQPPALARLGLLLAARHNLLRMADTAVRRYGDLVPLGWGASHAFLLVHPAHLRHVLQERAADYPAGGGTGLLRALLGEGLAMIEGERWQRDRALMLPAFHRERLARMTAVMTAATDGMLLRWRERASRGEALDLVPEARRLTMEIALRALFGDRLGAAAETLGAAWYEVTDALRRGWLPALGWRLAGGGRKLIAALGRLDQVVEEAIAGQRRHPADHGDMLSMLVAARDAEGRGLTDREVRDEVINILFGAYDTTTTTLVWAWVSLCRNPQAEERLRAELAAALDGGAPTFETFSRLTYARAVVQETMRLYPPAFLYGRRAERDDEIDAVPIPSGSAMLLCPYLTHRHPDFWSEPERFDPERFSPQRSAGRDPFSYLAFGRGPRQCIGSNFALLEGQVVLALTLRAFRMRLLAPPATPLAAGGVRPEGRVPVRLTPAGAD